MIKEGKFTFKDSEDNVIEVNVKNFKIIDNEWWSFLVEENVNHNVEIADGPKN
jgi:hypothetical protein